MSNDVSDPSTLAEQRREDAEESAAKYVWEYFKYHAAQRQAVFRFYLTLIGAATIAYAYSRRYPTVGNNSPEDLELVKSVVGGVYFVTSLLFWSLDNRSRRLIKLAENSLKLREERLAKLVDDPTIKLMELGEYKSERFPLSEIESFRQVYGCIFLTVAIIGTFLVHVYLGFAAVVLFVLWYGRDLIRRYRKGKVRFSKP